jgi:hypothetical protein
VRDRPSISPKSRDIALNSERFSKPIFSDSRYRFEVKTYVSKKEEDARTKFLMQKEKEIEEDQLMIMNSVHKNFLLNPDKRVSQAEFLKRYKQQVN